MRTGLLACTIAGVVALGAGTARADSARFSCTADAGHTCYFQIVYADGSHPTFFTVQGGQEHTEDGVRIGKDHYMASADKPTPHDSPDKCKLIDGCLYALIQASNDEKP